MTSEQTLEGVGRSIVAYLLCACFGVLNAQAGLAAAVVQAHSTAELASEQLRIEAGRTVTLGLHLKLEPGWHVYWKNPGDSGMATSVTWHLPEGIQAGPLQWPTPRRIDVGPITSYGYDDGVLLLSDLSIPASFKEDHVRVHAKADWLVCKEICIPASADLDLLLPISSGAQADVTWSALFEKTRVNLPRALNRWQIKANLLGSDLVIGLIPEAADLPNLKKMAFYPYREGDIDDSAEQAFERTDRGYQLRVKVAKTDTPILQLAGVIAAEPGFGQSRAVEIDLPVTIQAATAASQFHLTFAWAIGFALLGGLILNLMPCVFPVLAIKILGVTERAHGDRWKLREHGLLFATGVLASFLAIATLLLALRAQGDALGWGFQLQSPLVVTGLVLLLFALALNLSGVFQLGTRIQSVTGSLQMSNERLDALLSGLLATMVAAPCTAPFMGAALGYAITQPALEALVVFAAMALGMVVPYLMLCFFPSALRRLPPPGPWMETLKQLLAFPLYATVVWLIWVLGQQLGIDAAAKLLFALVLVACGLWLWGRRESSQPLFARTCRTFAGVVLLAASFFMAWPIESESLLAKSTIDDWAPWSEAAVSAALSEGKPVFVDFTAAWCVSCQVNKKLVLHTEKIGRRFDELGVVRFRADWTNRDAAITAALGRLSRSGVPVYALYAPGGGEPILLPEILTTGIVLDALGKLPVKVSGARPNSDALME